MCDDRNETERLDYYVDMAVKELVDHVKEFLDTNKERLEFVEEPHDWITECADSGVPVMNYTLLRMAANDIGLALTAPELGPAFDGTATPINIVAANVYESISNAMWDKLREIETELQEIRDHTCKAGECNDEQYCPLDEYDYEEREVVEG